MSLLRKSLHTKCVLTLSSLGCVCCLIQIYTEFQMQLEVFKLSWCSWENMQVDNRICGSLDIRKLWDVFYIYVSLKCFFANLYYPLDSLSLCHLSCCKQELCLWDWLVETNHFMFSAVPNFLKEITYIWAIFLCFTTCTTQKCGWKVRFFIFHSIIPYFLAISYIF